MTVHHPQLNVLGDASLDRAEEYLTLRDVVAFGRRNLLLIALFTAAAVALAVYYVVTATPAYTATVRLYIDPEQVRIASSSSTGDDNLGASEIESQVEIVRSEAIAASVIRDFDLARNPLFLEEPSIVQRARAWARTLLLPPRPEEELTRDGLLERAMNVFYSRLSVHRVGQSYVIQISYRSRDPVRAARIANATARAYIEASLAAKSGAAERGSRWLETRLAELSEKAKAAAASVAAFRAENELFEASTIASLEQQQLSGISTQLLEARSQSAEHAARLATIDKLLAASDLAEVTVGDVLRNPTIARLRGEIVAARTAHREAVERYGADSPPARTAARAADELSTGIRDELGRIRQSYDADLKVSRTRERSVAAELARIKAVSGERSQAHVELAELESRANTYRRVYETVLQQFEAAVQKASFPVSDARIVTPATVPFSKSHPKSGLVVAMAAVLGAMSGLGVALIRQSLDRRIGGAGRLLREARVTLLGGVPRTRRVPRVVPVPAGAAATPTHGADAPTHRVDTPTHRVEAAPGGAGRSPFLHALRGVKASVDLALPETGARVIGVTSMLPGEGRTTLAGHLALLYAAEGARTLLVEADPDGRSFLQPARAGRRETSLTHRPARGPDAYGAGSVATSGRTLEVRPAAALAPGGPAALALPGLALLKPQLRALRERHDMIVLDLPALERTADTRALSAQLDGLVVVCRYRKVKIDALVAALAGFGAARRKLLGVVVNRVPRRWRHA